MIEIFVLAVAGFLFLRHQKAGNMGNVNQSGPMAATRQAKNSAAPSFQSVAGRRYPVWRGETTVANARPKGGALVQTVAAPNMGRQTRGWNAVKPVIDPIGILPANKFAVFAIRPVAYAPPVGVLENQNGGAEIAY